jgi:hypothetical protein
MEIGNNVKTISKIVNYDIVDKLYDDIIRKNDKLASEFHRSTNIHQTLNPIASLYGEKRWEWR